MDRPSARLHAAVAQSGALGSKQGLNAQDQADAVRNQAQLIKRLQDAPTLLYGYHSARRCVVLAGNNCHSYAL